ncbi:hypothetical protein H696_03917 [Fonticula alba]|uniref:Cdc37 N-terminal domain-containing protein n=1 Tax=Fonticula alba TaxID=691883 RepID=A0A058Z5I1_FONAL|nr:hypothetical protein H696_03917 [Fonticula alba]KCV69495.1 hypothetical protein H696_03917 [Fonticula alba]|eukprot:XP_009496060.1 hypothetical protein H696_03917 [Fonticula alba]
MVDYSKWNTIELSDDDSDCHPNIERGTWLRLKKASKERKEAEEAARRAAEDAQEAERVEQIAKLEAEAAAGDLSAEQQATLDRLRAESDKHQAQRREEEAKNKQYPKWSDANICTEKFSKTILNTGSSAAATTAAATTASTAASGPPAAKKATVTKTELIHDPSPKAATAPVATPAEPLSRMATISFEGMDREEAQRLEHFYLHTAMALPSADRSASAAQKHHDLFAENLALLRTPGMHTYSLLVASDALKRAAALREDTVDPEASVKAAKSLETRARRSLSFANMLQTLNELNVNVAFQHLQKMIKDQSVRRETARHVDDYYLRVLERVPELRALEQKEAEEAAANSGAIQDDEDVEIIPIEELDEETRKLLLEDQEVDAREN